MAVEGKILIVGTQPVATSAVDAIKPLGGMVLWAGVPMALGSASAALLGAWLIRRDPAFDVSVASLRNMIRVGLLAGFVGDVAHALKSPARTMDALALGELSQQLEDAARSGDASGGRDLTTEVPQSFSLAQQQIDHDLRQPH